MRIAEKKRHIDMFHFLNLVFVCSENLFFYYFILIHLRPSNLFSLAFQTRPLFTLHFRFASPYCRPISDVALLCIHGCSSTDTYIAFSRVTPTKELTQWRGEYDISSLDTLVNVPLLHTSSKVSFNIYFTHSDSWHCCFKIA